MRFTPLIHAIISAKTESELRSQVMDKAGRCIGAQAWGLDLLNHQQQILTSDLQGLPVSFCDRYQAIGREQDLTSQKNDSPTDPCTDSIPIYSTADIQCNSGSFQDLPYRTWSRRSNFR